MDASELPPAPATGHARPTLLTFALVSHSLEQSSDILTGLMPLFDPVLRALGTNPFTSTQFSEEVVRFYGLYINPIAAEDILSRLEKAKRLQRVGGTAFICTQASNSKTADLAGVEKILDNLMVSLRSYANNFASAVKIDLTSEQLETALLDFLIDRNIPRNLANPADGQMASARYLISRFILDLERRNPELVDDLAQISAAAMVSEVVLDLRQPPDLSRSNPRIELIIDAPIAMCMLGLSGTQRQRDVTYIIDQAKTLRGSISVFRHSIAEMENIIFATLEQAESARTGPLADALRDKEIMEVYARQVLANLDGNLRNIGLTIQPDKSSNIGYFDDEMCAVLNKEMRGYFNAAARERDVRSIAQVMRLRRDEKSNDPLRTKYLFITLNDKLVQTAKKFCVDHDLMSRYHTGPAIDLRRLAALLWVTLGSKEDRVTMSKRQLLANCGQAVASRPDIVGKMMDTLGRVSPGTLPQLRYLLSLPRSAQMLMDATIGDEQVVNPTNVDEIMRVVRKAAIQDLTIEAERALDAQRSFYEQQIEQIRRESAAAQEQDRGREAELKIALEDLATKFEFVVAEQARLRAEKEKSIQYAILGCVQEIVLRRKRAVVWTKIGITLVAVPALVYATFVTSSVVSTNPLVMWLSAILMAGIACSGIIALWRSPFAFVQRAIARRTDASAMRRLERRLTLMNLNVHLDAVMIDWRLGQVNWKQPREGNVGPQHRPPLEA
jgi:hypothetical protein